MRKYTMLHAGTDFEQLLNGNGKLIWNNKVKWNHLRCWKVQHLSAAFSSLVFLPRYYSPNQPFFSVFMHILVLKGDNSESTTSKKLLVGQFLASPIGLLPR